MQRIDRVIQDAALAKRYLEVQRSHDRLPLIDSACEYAIENTLGNFGYFGIYDTDESGYKCPR